jgi:hypothetical protein
LAVTVLMPDSPLGMLRRIKFVLAFVVVPVLGVGVGVFLGARPEDLVTGALCILTAIAYGLAAAGISTGQPMNAFFPRKDEATHIDVHEDCPSQ